MVLKDLTKAGKADPIAVMVTACVGMLGVFGVPEMVGLDGSEVSALLGFSGMFIAAIRAMWNVSAAKEMELPPE